MQRLKRMFCSGFRPNALLLHQRLWRQLLSGYFVVALCSIPPVAVGQPPTFSATPTLQDNMDGQVPVLQPLTAGSGFSLGQRSVDRKTFRHGTGAERILLRGPAGKSAQVVYPLPGASVIQELSILAEVATNRGGLQLAARVVLPRSVNPTTGRPFELLVRDGKVGSGGDWEQLTLENLPQQLANHARVARVQHGAALDERGAYMSQIVFLAPGGPGLTELIVDRIQVFGVVNQQLRSIDPTRIQEATAQWSRSSNITTNAISSAEHTKRFSRVPRIIQWQGESFELLQKLGFNTIGMSRLPSAEELQQVERLGLSLHCPPPTPQQLSELGITADLDPVIAWNLGEQLSADDLEYVGRWEQLVGRHDPIDARPTVLAPQLHTLEASRIADVMLVGRAVVGTELTIREHTAWLAQRQRLARPGTPLWTKIETQPSLSQQMQLAALSSRGLPAQDATYSQLTALISASLSIKTRGYYFQSQTSLAAQDAATRRRALALELTNLRLQLTEPWMKEGKELSAARSTQTELSALVLQAERSHLLAPIWWSLDMQSTVHPRTTGPVSFIVPGVAESSEAFLLTLGGLQRVRRQRVTGGIRVSLEELPYDGFILLSDDPQTLSQVTHYLRRIAPRAAKIRRELANLRLQEATSLIARIGATETKFGQAQAILQRARGELAACDRFLSTGNFEYAYLRADAVDLLLDKLEKAIQTAAEGARSLVQTTTSHGPITLPDRLLLQKRLARAPVSANLLSGGGFENLSSLLEHGWRHQQLPLEGITSSVRLSPEAPHSGSYCLELEARALDEGSPVTIVPTAPVWISSASLQVRAGDLLEITGVARLPEPLVGSVDGLQIIDSIGGPDMALRIQDAPSWQPFRLIRAATADSHVSVTIALSGLGKAQIDDVAIRIVRK